ncbi:MAG: hypothetical protein ACPGEF_04730 [Endozoicomonas sp.]
MKRYKQSILSNFFVTKDETGTCHLVEANLDIEVRSDHTLCTEVLQNSCRFQVLENQHLSKVCLICSAILDRRISNMPVERKPSFTKEQEKELPATSGSQLPLLSFVEIKQKWSGQKTESNDKKQPEQFELIL